MNEDYISHYGVLGMKWGVRKDRERAAKKHFGNSNREAALLYQRSKDRSQQTQEARAQILAHNKKVRKEIDALTAKLDAQVAARPPAVKAAMTKKHISKLIETAAKDPNAVFYGSHPDDDFSDTWDTLRKRGSADVQKIASKDAKRLKNWSVFSTTVDGLYDNSSAPWRYEAEGLAQLEALEKKLKKDI